MKDYLYIDFNLESEVQNQHFIIIEFNKSPDLNTLREVYKQRRTVQGQQQLLDLYKTLLIKDALVKNYQEDDPIRPGITDNSKL